MPVEEVTLASTKQLGRSQTIAQRRPRKAASARRDLTPEPLTRLSVPHARVVLRALGDSCLDLNFFEQAVADLPSSPTAVASGCGSSGRVARRHEDFDELALAFAQAV